jgi:hypothetical protein
MEAVCHAIWFEQVKVSFVSSHPMVDSKMQCVIVLTLDLDTHIWTNSLARKKSVKMQSYFFTHCDSAGQNGRATRQTPGKKNGRLFFCRSFSKGSEHPWQAPSQE